MGFREAEQPMQTVGKQVIRIVLGGFLLGVGNLFIWFFTRKNVSIQKKNVIL